VQAIPLLQAVPYLYMFNMIHVTKTIHLTVSNQYSSISLMKLPIYAVIRNMYLYKIEAFVFSRCSPTFKPAQPYFSHTGFPAL